MDQIARFLPNDEYQAAIAANAPTALNPFATIADIPAAAVTLYNGNSTIGTTRVATLTDSLQFAGAAGTVTIGDGAIGTAKLTTNGIGTTSATLNQVWRDSALATMASVRDDGRWGFNTAPITTDRISITAGAGLTGAINIIATDQVTDGYSIRSQSGATAGNHYGIWSNALAGTANVQAFRGTVYSAGATINEGAYLSARNGTNSSVGVWGQVSGGDSVNSTESIGVKGSNESQISTDRRAGYFYIVNDVAGGTSYALKAVNGVSGAGAINYGLHSNAFATGAGRTNYAAWLQADGGAGAINYALVTNGGNIGFGTTTPNQQVMLQITPGTRAHLLLDPILSAVASGITPTNGMEVYVSDTDATFTSVGFWSYENGAWTKSVATATNFVPYTGATSTVNLGAQNLTTTGTGAFTTSLTTPLIYGGTAAGSFIDHISTTGVGTTTGLAWRLNGGTNGATNIMNIYNDAQVLINTTVRNPGALGIFRVAKGTSTIDIGQTLAGVGAIWMSVATPTTSNYVLSSNGTNTTIINTPSSGNGILLNVANVTRYTFGNTNTTLAPAATTSGVLSAFTFTAPASTLQTAGTESITVKWSLSATMQHASNTAIALQRDFVIDARTHTFATAGGVITDAVVLGVVGGPIAGTNATITNSHAIRVPSTNVAGAGTTTNSYGLTVNAQTGATNNYAAQFIGGSVLFRGSVENNRGRIARTLYVDTTDATVTELTADGAAGSGATNRIKVPLNMGMSVLLNIVAKQSGSANTRQFLRQFVIVNNGGTTSIEGAVQVLGTDEGSVGLAATTVTITANDTDDCIKVEVTGKAATNIRWTSHIVSAEAIYA